jgi:hypothetical protein
MAKRNGNGLCGEAAERLEALEAQNKRLREALTICSAVLNNSNFIETTDDGKVPLTNTMEALLKARAALNNEKG